MNKELMCKAGLSKEVNMVKGGLCPMCGEKVCQDLCPDPKLCTKLNIQLYFRDELSRKEFDISGMCQRCQDEVFN